MNRYLCIVAGQRAGTTALQSALASTKKFCNFKEVFHTETPESPGSFLQYARDKDLKVADMATYEQAIAVANQYLTHLRELAGTSLPLLDVKLNSWHIIKPFWSYVHERPLFMNALIKEGAIFLFIRRRDLLEQIVSEQIARSTGKWHGLENSDVAGQISVNCANISAQARLIVQAETFLLGCLAPSNRLLAIDYEDLYPQGEVNPNLLRALEARFHIELPETLSPPIKKNVPDKRRVVANYDDAANAVNDILKRFPRAKYSEQIQI